MKNTEPTTSRRNFLFKVSTAFMGALSALAAWPVISYLLSPLKQHQRSREVSLPLPQIQPNTPVKITFTKELQDAWQQRFEHMAAYLVLDAQGIPNVFSTRCPHLGCSVSWNESAHLFACPCHGGRFSISGDRESGPPPRGLFRIESRVEGNKLILHV